MIQITEGQNLFDIALQTTGTIESSFEILALNSNSQNELNLSSVLEPGQTLEIPELNYSESDKEVKQYFENSTIRINTGSINVSGAFNNDFNADFS